MSSAEPPEHSQLSQLAPLAPSNQRSSAHARNNTHIRSAILIVCLIAWIAISQFLWGSLNSFGYSSQYLKDSATETAIEYLFATVTANAPTPTPTVAPIVAKIGTTITLDGLAVTLQSATTIPGDQEVQPLPGNTFVVVHVIAQNVGTAPKEFLCLDFLVISGARTFNTPQEVAPASYTGARNLYDAPDRLLPGDSAEGDLIIQAPTDDHLAELTWDPFFSSEVGTYGWNLGL